MDNDTLKLLLSPREKFISAFKALVLLGKELESNMKPQDQPKLEKLINNCFATVDLDQDDIIKEYQRCLDVTTGTIWSNYRIELRIQAEQYSICITETIENTRLLDIVRPYE